MKFFTKNLLSSMLSGILIACGGFVYLICTQKFDNGALYGAMLFSIGLFVILVYKLNLFTGKVCYMLFENKTYNVNLLTILIGNFIGAVSTGYLFRLCSSDLVLTLSETIAKNKIDNNPFIILILSIFCGIMIYLAVDIYKEAKHEIAKYFAVVICITVFILCGFEHCIANMFYFSIANAWNLSAFIALIIMIIGNTIGGSVFPLIRHFIKLLDENKQNG